MPKKVRTGKVIANTNTNTVTIVVERMKVHPLYKKQYRVTKKYHADTAGKQYEIGDIVEIEETKPISKTKRWVVTAQQSSAKQG
jgi:small subunit ribosomal protein S17